MNANLKFVELYATLAVLSPASQAPGTVVTPWVPAANLHRVIAEIQTGVLGTGATIDAKLRQATNSSGTGAKDVPGKALTQIVKASGDNDQAFIEATGDDLDSANGYGYVQLSLTVGVAASLVSASLKGRTRYNPASAYNQASVVQMV